MIRKSLSFIGFWVAAFVFCIALPTYAFMLAYPGGPRDIYEHLNFDIEQQNYTTTKVLQLPDHFGEDDVAGFIAIGQALKKASSTDRIVIEVRENQGGNIDMLNVLKGQIKSSKGFVVLKLNKFGASCGARVLNMGNIVFVPYDGMMMFHLGSLTFDDGSTYQVNSVSIKTEVRMALGTQLMAQLPLLNWFTPEEFLAQSYGADIYITGKQLCYKEGGRNPDVLFHLSDGCVIRGSK